MWGFAAYLLAVNAATYAAFAHDKAAAQRGDRRVREATLFGLAAAGGTPAAFAARRVLRHKTRKAGFGTLLWLIAGAQAGVLGYLAWAWM